MIQFLAERRCVQTCVIFKTFMVLYQGDKSEFDVRVALRAEMELQAMVYGRC